MTNNFEAKFRALEIQHELEQLKKELRQTTSQTGQQRTASATNNNPPPPASDKIKRFYKILGLQPDAPLKEVKQAYRALLKKWHPDLFQDNPQLQQKAQEVVKKLNEIYDELCS